MAHSPASRSGVAFVQHANYRAVVLHSSRGENGRLWAGSKQKIFNIEPNENDINIHASIVDFFRANPRLFLQHVKLNVQSPLTIGFFLLLTLLLVLPWLSPRYNSARSVSLFLLLLSIPVVASFVLIYPRAHYAVTIAPSMILLALQLLSTHRRLAAPPAWSVLLLGTLIMLPEARAYRHGNVPDIYFHLRESLATIRCLRDTQAAQNLQNQVIFDQDQPFTTNVYINGHNLLTAQAGEPQWPAFTAWVAQKHPAWVVSNAALSATYNRAPADIATSLQKDFGYVPMACPQAPETTIFTQPAAPPLQH